MSPSIRTSELSLRELTRPVVGRVRLASALEAVGRVAELAPVVAVVEVSSALVDGDDSTTASGVWVIVAACGVLVALGAQMSSAAIAHRADIDLAFDLRLVLLRALSRLPLGWFDQGSSGRTAEVIDGSVRGLHDEVAHKTPQFVGGVAAAIASMTYLLVLSPPLACVLLLLVTVLHLLRNAMLTRMSRPYARHVAAQNEMSAAVTELVQGAEVAKYFAAVDETNVGPVGRYRRAADAMTDAVAEATIPGSLGRAMLRTATSPATVAVFVVGFGLLFAAAGAADAGALVGFLILAGNLVAATEPLFDRVLLPALRASGKPASAALVHADAIESILTEPPLPVPSAGAVAAASQSSPMNVRFENVTFGYRPDHPVVHDFSLSLTPGSVTALVGPSGSGKSTIAELLARFRDPQDGRITVDGKDIRELTTQDLYSRVGFVFQDIGIVQGTIAENIALGRPAASSDEIAAAARKANIHDFITELPQRYDTEIGGDRLSGGQRQRIAVARALLAAPPIVVLDEATSFADPESEAAVQESLSQLIADRTVLVVAHRLHTVVGADNIVLLDDGRIAESGTHDDLIRRRGGYAALWAEAAR